MVHLVASATDSATEDFADRLAERIDGLAPAERRVAERLLDLGPDATLLSAAALAERLSTSDATIVRTAKALGYRGLAELRRALAASATNPPPGERLRRTLDASPREEIFEAAIERHLAGLDTMLRNVSGPQFAQAVAVMSDSMRVVWRGVGPSAHLAAYAQMLTQRVGKPSAVLVHTGTSFADELLTLQPGDAVVVFAYGRMQSHVRVLVERAAELGIAVVLVTDTLARRLHDAVAVTLECGRGEPGLFASHGTTLVLVEALVVAMAAADRESSAASLGTLNEMRAALAGRRIDVDTP